MKTSDFYYDLPHELIAQTPTPCRSASRLLVYDRQTKSVSDRVFSDIIDYLTPDDVLVRNTTRVIPARLFGTRPDTGGTMEFLLLRRTQGDDWECLCRSAKRAKVGTIYHIGEDLSAEILNNLDMEGGKLVRLSYSGIFEEVLDKVGQTPLPPYITERLDDKERYQTVYARQNGSAAAPTAGLHFTPELLSSIRDKGVDIVDILLHVGLGTFRPVSEANVEDHHMHTEYYEVSDDAAKRINRARERGGRIICVGTTSARTLESVADDNGVVCPGSGMTGIFITPPYRFKAVDALITNFHLPESTLLMLVSALCSREEILSVYKHAVDERYRFFSFGDAMLIK
ncbi:MAG TPA: tRNA preQ1(34) S-adenosylmethionine ribosyltransferase-isomerase QueA [Eubacteriales bacterium]|nr:tRNA preQ1(34) S-adenosylmethionine ribosyltransferase-isomerase QueA [Clostridia bacterium]HRV72362.1 tRNA preQ1(34) S-adenosylmethionine ribosyltransferase-isomerase QueA [Eubacteriales bacterium]